MLGVLTWVFSWWITEAVPMPVTSMSPLFLFPLFGIATADDVAKTYMDDVIALVLGSFILALAVEHYNVHRRLALNHVDAQHPDGGDNDACGDRDIAAVSGRGGRAGAGEEVLQGDGVGGDICNSNWGISTLTGTGVNLILGTSNALSVYMDKAHLRRELQLLGPMAFAEKMVVAVFAMLVVLWMTRNITDDIPGWSILFNGRVGDGTVSVMMATLLFIIPDGKQKREKLMDWSKCKKLPWGIILLLGAGFAIADGVRTSGLADVLSADLGFLENVPYLAIAPAVCLISGFITEFTSNNSTTTLVLPLLIQVAKTMNLHPLYLMVPGAIGAQFAYILPTSTPSNVVGFSTGHIDINDMIKTGLPLKVAGMVALTVFMPSLGAYVSGRMSHYRTCSTSADRSSSLSEHFLVLKEPSENMNSSLMHLYHL
ncbi:hypothetical protein Scep_012570 [Stephania cephalantha]|uniref:Tonoplast dicarboxylate transporter n=1 Tax=Stephania cephalantha TaxID=152367 RepID=A0AAP0P6L3_9MAGN